MLNFTVGPVMMNNEIKKVGAEDIPYFRTQEFSEVYKQIEVTLLKYFFAPEDSRIILMTGSGTASMEAAMINTLTEKDKVLVINGGSFGHRFVELCQTFSFDYEEVVCEFGKTLSYEQLYKYDNCGYTALLVNMDETSSGVLYDMKMISDFCKKNNIFLIVDSISSFLCDNFNMKDLHANIVITGSQKALAIPPGISIICCDSIARNRIYSNTNPCYYFDLKKYLENGTRGQTPFTPAVGIILQLKKRLENIEKNGGVEVEIRIKRELAAYFREKIHSLPLELFADKMSNAVTALQVQEGKDAYLVFETLKNEYGIFVCPNGGEYKHRIFRVGHIGDISIDDINALLSAMNDLMHRDII